MNDITQQAENSHMVITQQAENRQMLVLRPFLEYRARVKNFLKLSHLYHKELHSVARGQKQIPIKNAKKQTLNLL